MKPLVFLEDHEGRLQKDSLGVLSKAASLGGEVEAVLLGSEVEGLAADAGKFGAQRVYVQDDVLLGSPLPQPRVDVLETLVRDGGFDAVLFAASVLSADVAAGLAARLDAGLNYDLTDLAVEDGKLVGKRPALGDSVYVEVGWSSEPRLALVRSGTFEPAGERRLRGGARSSRRASRTSRSRRRWSSRPTRRARGRRSRTPT